nr:hypothetical protein Iba_chr09aCG6080 [Ipomoea batatas]
MEKPSGRFNQDLAEVQSVTSCFATCTALLWAVKGAVHCIQIVDELSGSHSGGSASMTSLQLWKYIRNCSTFIASHQDSKYTTQHISHVNLRRAALHHRAIVIITGFAFSVNVQAASLHSSLQGPFPFFISRSESEEYVTLPSDVTMNSLNADKNAKGGGHSVP